MRAIVKGTEPRSLTTHRLTPHCDYENYADMDTLRAAIFAEQFGLCCYCMRQIYEDSALMKIEHWRCQSRYPGGQLDYRNLLGACKGGSGQPPDHQHCDTRKGDRDLRWNPANPAHNIEQKIRYEADGTIRSDDPEFDVQLGEVLNLNVTALKSHRRGVFSAMTEWLKAEKAKLQGPVPRARLEREREKRATGDLRGRPFGRVAVWFLDQRLSRVG